MILIRNGEIIDGTGAKSFKADVLIKHDKISAIGNFPKSRAEVIIDARGSYVMPGFVDINTDADHYLSLFTNPGQDSFLKQGVTTTIGGQCGSSLAPLVYGSLESIRKWGDVNEINVGWHTVSEFLDILESHRLGVNFGTLIGHSTIRRALIGENIRDLTKNELSVFVDMVRKGLQEGALGLSTGLGYAHSYTTPYKELKLLAEEVAKHDALYSTHLRSEREHLTDAMSETIKLVKATGVNALISHLRPLVGFEAEFEKSFNLIESLGKDQKLQFDSYPSDTSLVPIYTLLPRWAKDGGLEIMHGHIKNGNTRKKIIKEFPDLDKGDVMVAHAPGQEYLVGKTLGDFAVDQELKLSEALLRLMHITDLRAIVLYKNINLDVVVQSLLSDRALVASNSPGFPEGYGGVQHERLFNTFPKYLEIMTSMQFISKEEAVQKITSIPAKKCRLEKRGELKEGRQADVVVMHGGKINHVLVNGGYALRDGEVAEIKSGEILRRM